MECTLELTRVQYTGRTIYEALNPSETDLCQHPRSSLYVRNCFFRRLDTIAATDYPKPTTVQQTLVACLKVLLQDVHDTSAVPMWARAVDFQYVTSTPPLPNIYMNVNMDSTNKYLLVFNANVAVRLKVVAGVVRLYRASNGQPYKLKTLLKELGVK